MARFVLPRNFSLTFLFLYLPRADWPSFFFPSSTDKFAKFKDRLFDILDRDPVADSSGNKKGGGYPFGLTLDDHATVQSRWIVSGGGQPFAKDIYLEFCAILLMNSVSGFAEPSRNGPGIDGQRLQRPHLFLSP